jgi:phage terminase large subunit GpA-like protein
MKPDAYALFTNAVAEAVKPRERLSLSQWADAHRILSGKGASERGQWRTDRTPYLREIMDCLSDSSPVQRVVAVKSTQVGLTEVALNWLGYHVHRQLGPMLVVVPTLDVRKKWVLQRLHPMLTETECLAKLAKARTRDSANSEDIKDYPGALVVLSGANSPASLASMPIKHVVCDEVDRFPWESGDEGDPLGLIQRRTSNFPRRKVLLISSPTIKGASRIDEEYEASDQRQYHVPCPDCGHQQPLVWAQLQWNADRSAVWYTCTECGSAIDEHYKTPMLAAGRWVPRHPERRTRGYQINGLYAPIGLGLTWRELVDDWLAAKGDLSKLKRFINTALGEAWEDERSKRLSPKGLADRAGPYRVREVPPGCLILTAGVDTQDDRLAVQVVGWGADGRRWVIDYVELPGSPARADVWDQLTELINAPLVNAWGREMQIEATAIDSGGHFTHEVYLYVRSARVRRPMAIKGSSTPGRSILAARPNAVDVRSSGRVIKSGVKVWMVGTEAAKHNWYNLLTSDTDQAADERLVHFPAELDISYYQGLIAETFDPERNRFVLRKGKRNEPLDTAVYAMTAAHHPEIRVHAMHAPQWERLAQQLERATDAEPTPPPEKPTTPRASRRDNYTKNWRR